MTEDFDLRFIDSVSSTIANTINNLDCDENKELHDGINHATLIIKQKISESIVDEMLIPLKSIEMETEVDEIKSAFYSCDGFICIENAMFKRENVYSVRVLI